VEKIKMTTEKEIEMAAEKIEIGYTADSCVIHSPS
jgi:hypothetical protein